MQWRLVVLFAFIIGQLTGWLLLPGASEAAAGGVFISELQTSGSGTGHSNDEFVELYNSTDHDVAVTGWQLQYRAATTTNGTDCTSTKVWISANLPNTNIKAHGFLLLADTHYDVVADGRFSLSLASTSGTVRVIDGSKATVDALAWGDGTPCGFGTSPAISTGQSLERLPGLEVPGGGNGYNSADNDADFIARDTPEPQAVASPKEDPLRFEGDGGQPGQLRLSEILVKPAADSPDEPFLELQNVGVGPVATSKYILRMGVISYYLPQHVVTPGAYLTLRSSDLPLVLPTSGGTVELLAQNGAQLDTTTWGNAPAGAAWARVGDIWDWTAQSTPGLPNRAVDVPAELFPGQGGVVQQSTFEITELLADPAAPGTDATDEFIEIHNYGQTELNLAGYVLKTGSDLGSHYSLPAMTLAPDGYAAFTSEQTHLSLTNSGSKASLFDPANTQVGEVITYGAAATGQAWAQFDDGWHWTTTPTPGAANILTAPAAVAGAATAAAKKAAKPAAAKAPKAAAAKKATTKAAAKPKATAKPKKAAAKKPAPLVAGVAKASGPWLLFVLAGLTICYAIYEFRYDIRNYYYRLRGYTSRGRQARPAAAGRGSD
jgi:hypothetical protein